ncbi:hypothetical protein [Methanosarcina sp. Kolksee]|uniref:hypothetical protein n=1 Tax=Methanosarcina sp. Kolksee TaxID=1434099 RepID=UPI0012E03C18|nr:hypothetical protein [Methanosarcina sp. Kolksee]
MQFQLTELMLEIGVFEKDTSNCTENQKPRYPETKKVKSPENKKLKYLERKITQD